MKKLLKLTVIILLLSSCSDRSNIKFTERNQFHIGYKKNWKMLDNLEERSNQIILRRDQKNYIPTDYYLDTDFAEISILEINFNNLKNIIPSVDDLYYNTKFKDSNDTQDSLLEIHGKIDRINEIIISEIRWTTEISNGIAIYFPGDNDKKKIIVLKMIYGNKDKKRIEKEFYEIFNNLKIN